MSSNWQYLTPIEIGQPGSNVRANGGAGAQALNFRDPLDARRAAMGDRVPSAEYPDGYLGSIQSRREDRLLNTIKGRLTQRSYQRGVHKGERIDPQDYYWSEDVRPDIGLEYQALGLRWTQTGTPVERLTAQGSSELADPRKREALTRQFGVDDRSRTAQIIDPVRQQRMNRLLPNWR
jgi:hypothetical protein